MLWVGWVSNKYPQHVLWRTEENWVSSWQNQQNDCAPSLIRVFAVRSVGSSLRTQAFFVRSAKSLIRLGGCPGWSVSSLDAHAILLVLSWCGSYINFICFTGNYFKDIDGQNRTLFHELFLCTWWSGTEKSVNNSIMSRLMTKLTKWHVRPVKTQISLGIRTVWSESSLSAWRNVGF